MLNEVVGSITATDFNQRTCYSLLFVNQVLNKKSVSCCFFNSTNLGKDHWELVFFGATCLFPEWRRATFLSTSRKTSSTRRSSRKRNRTLIGRKSTEKTEVACDRWRQSGIGWCSGLSTSSQLDGTLTWLLPRTPSAGYRLEPCTLGSACG